MRGLTQGSALDSGFEIWRALFAFAVEVMSAFCPSVGE